MARKQLLGGAVCVVLFAALLSAFVPTALAKYDEAALDKAVEALKTYDWGGDRKALGGIDAAIVATHGDDAGRKDVEKKLIGALKGESSRAAKDQICRALSLVGSAESVPALAALLPDKDNSHMARYALERIPGDEATTALREALGKVSGQQKIGVLSSLAVRRDEKALSAIAALLKDSDQAAAAAAAAALGAIGNADAVKALGEFAKNAPDNLQPAVADAQLAAAERLLAAGKKMDAMQIYKSLSGEKQPKHIRAAATRGMLQAAGAKKD